MNQWDFGGHLSYRCTRFISTAAFSPRSRNPVTPVTVANWQPACANWLRGWIVPHLQSSVGWSYIWFEFQQIRVSQTVNGQIYHSDYKLRGHSVDRSVRLCGHLSHIDGLTSSQVILSNDHFWIVDILSTLQPNDPNDLGSFLLSPCRNLSTERIVDFLTYSNMPTE